MVPRLLLYGSSAMVAYQVLRLARRYWRWYISPLWSLPGPSRIHSSFLVGIFPQIMKQPFMALHMKWWEKAGKKSTDMLHYTGLFGNSTVVLLNADHIRTMLMSNYRSNPRFVKNFRSLEKGILGKGLVTLEGEDWHRHRRIIHPSFQEKFLKAKMQAAVPSRVQFLLDCWKKAGSARPIDVSSHFSMLTLDILGEIAFAHNFGGMSGIQQWCSDDSSANRVPPVSDRLVASMTASMNPTPFRFLLSILNLSFLDWESQRTHRTLNEAVDEVVRNARERCQNFGEAVVNGNGKPAVRKSRGKYEAKSMLELMLGASDTEVSENNEKERKLNDQDLRDEVKTFLVAGHETTSSWCHWAIYCLCKYPGIQEKVFEDISKHWPSGVDDTSIGLDSIEKMKYFDAFLKEVLRLHSPVGVVVRGTVEDEQFGDVSIPAGTKLMVATYLLHRSPRYWKDPLEFQPERWMTGEAPYSHLYAYLPFSSGPRNCIGYRFATLEAKLILAAILKNVQFQLTPELESTEFTLKSYVTVKTTPAVQVNAIFREDS